MWYVLWWQLFICLFIFIYRFFYSIEVLLKPKAMKSRFRKSYQFRSVSHSSSACLMYKVLHNSSWCQVLHNTWLSLIMKLYALDPWFLRKIGQSSLTGDPPLLYAKLCAFLLPKSLCVDSPQEAFSPVRDPAYISL